MKKTIKIGNKEYFMASSAYTQFAYKDETGRSLLSDLQSVINLKSKKEKDFKVDDLDLVTELLLKVSYVMIKEAGESQVEDYISFMKGIEDLYSDQTWYTEVLGLACNPISGRLQTNNK